MIETKAKNDLINDLINDLKNKDDIILWIENLIASNLSPSDKIDILKYEKSYLQNVDKSGLSDNYKFFLDLISEENYVDAVRFSDYLSYIILPQKRDEIKETIKNRKFYFLTPKLEIEMGGMGRTILYRANFLANEGYDITLVNIGPVKNYPFIENYYEKKNLYSNNIKNINIFEYYSQKNTRGPNKENLKDIQDKDIIKKENRDNSITLEYHKNEKVKKTEIYIDNCLVYIECDDYNKYLTKDGFIFLINDKKNKKFYLNERDTEITLEFKNQLELLYHFIDEICLNDDEKPFIICDATSHWYNINSIKQKDAYKIGALHGPPFIGHNPKNKINKNINSLTHIDEMDKVVLLTNDLKEDLTKLYDPNKLAVIPNFIFEEKLEYGEVKKNVNKIAAFSRISSEKQISHMIKAFEIISKQNKNIILEIYGGSSRPLEEREEARLKKLTKELKLETQVIFKGFSSDIDEPMRESLATLLTSKYEGLPLSVLESMTNSTAVIAYKCYYGPTELISDNVDGILIEKDNIEELVKAILRLIENPQIAIEMGKKGKEKIMNNYTLSVIGPKWEELFIDVFIECEINDFIEKATLKDNYNKVISQNINLKNTNKQLKKDNSKLEKENKKLNKFKKDVMESSSWNITKPLRKITKIIKRK